MTPIGWVYWLTPRDAVRLVETLLELLHVVGGEQRRTARDELSDLWDAMADGTGPARWDWGQRRSGGGLRGQKKRDGKQKKADKTTNFKTYFQAL